MWLQFWGSPQSQITPVRPLKRGFIHVTQASKKILVPFYVGMFIISSYFTSFSLISHSFFLKLAVNEKGMSKTREAAFEMISLKCLKVRQSRKKRTLKDGDFHVL